MQPSAPHVTPPRDTASRLRVVTWNVGEVYWPWQGNQLKDCDVQLVIDALCEIDADVVLLQELAHAGQLARLTGTTYAGAMPARCGYDRHVALLVRSSLRPTFAEHVLAPTSRAAMEARFDYDGIPVRAWSLHFDVFRPARRLEQMRTAAKLIDESAGEPDVLTIAGGDFNYDPAVSARLGRSLDAEAEATMHRLRDLAPDSGPTLVGLLRVDRVLGGGTALRSAAARVSQHRLPLGDHAPVVCDCDLQRSTVDAVGKAP